MDLLSTIKISIKSILAHKVRTGLTVLGIVIGIASVIIVFSAGEGIKSLIFGQIESFGTDIIETEIKIPTGKRGTESETQSAAALVQGVQVTTLTIEDLEDVKKVPNIKNGYAALISQEQVSYGNELKKAMIFGVSAAYIDIDKSQIDYGRFFSEAEDKGLAEVAVLGQKIKEKLFGDVDPIDKYIKIRKEKFRVIGVMQEKGAVMTLDFDDFVYLPIRTLQKRIMGVDYVIYTVHQLDNLDLADETAEQARLVIRQNHNIASIPVAGGYTKTIMDMGQGETDTSKDDFRVVTMAESMEVLSVVMGAVTLLLLAIVAISLIVGGVGVMNVMYVIVQERTAEIGLRKAVGASFNNIMLQFLIESILITITGGILGIALGIIISLVITFGAKSFGLDWKFIIPLKSFITALIFSLVFGVLFGLYPARRAAKLDPVEALRNE